MRKLKEMADNMGGVDKLVEMYEKRAREKAHLFRLPGMVEQVWAFMT